MKLLYLVNARIPTPRAYGLQIMKTCEAFVRAGAHVELVVPTRYYKSPEDPFEYYHADRCFAITTVPVPDFLKYGVLGFLISTVWFAEKVRWYGSFRSATIVYSRDALVLVQYLLLGRTVVFESHARPTFVSTVVARRAHRVVVISKGLASAYETVGVDSRKIIIAPDAVDEHLFDAIPSKDKSRSAVGLTESTPIVLYAGHLYERKGAGTLAAAAALVPEATFVFVGGAPEDVAAFRDRWGGANNVRIIGHMPFEKIPLYLRAADVLVLPNSGKDDDSARFTSPMKLFEYMASGTPIVASRVPAVEEILTDSEAIFVAPDDPGALANGLRAVFRDPEAADQRAQAARTKVREYSWSGRAHTILAHVQ